MPVAPPTFKPTWNVAGTARAKQDHDQRRGSARARGYDTRWDKARKGYLRSNPLCICCKANGAINTASIVDHVEPHKGDQAKFWDVTNWQPLCEWCDKNVKRSVENAWLAGRMPISALHLDRSIPGWLHPRHR